MSWPNGITCGLFRCSIQGCLRCDSSISVTLMYGLLKRGYATEVKSELINCVPNVSLGQYICINGSTCWATSGLWVVVYGILMLLNKIGNTTQWLASRCWWNQSSHAYRGKVSAEDTVIWNYFPYHQLRCICTALISYSDVAFYRASNVTGPG